MSDFDERWEVVRAPAGVGGGFLNTGPGLLVAAIFCALAGYFGLAAATGRLPLQFAWLAEPAESKLEKKLIESRLAACMPPKSSDPWERRILENYKVRGQVFLVDQNNPESAMSAGEGLVYLECAVKTERKRFCKSSWRKKFASQISSMYRLFYSFGLDSPLGERITADWLAEHRKALEASRRSPGLKNIFTQNPVILDMVRQLSRDGLLSARDFGFFGPPEPIKTVLEKEPRGTGNFCL